MTIQTIDVAGLETITGGGSVDYSLQGQWIDKSIASIGRAGFGTRINNSGLSGVRNPDMTNVIRFPGG